MIRKDVIKVLRYTMLLLDRANSFSIGRKLKMPLSVHYFEIEFFIKTFRVFWITTRNGCYVLKEFMRKQSDFFNI